MTAYVTHQEARTINRFFAASKVVRELSDRHEHHKLTKGEARKLIHAMDEVADLRPLVCGINQASLGR